MGAASSLALALSKSSASVPADVQNTKKHIPFRAFLVPVLFLVCSGLVASRLSPDGKVGLVFNPTQPEDAPPGRLAESFIFPQTTLSAQCHDWCISRNESSSHAPAFDNCFAQCRQHPEVMSFLSAMRASAAVPPSGEDHNIIFAAWYAEGEGGAEVCCIPGPPLMIAF